MGTTTTTHSIHPTIAALVAPVLVPPRPAEVTVNAWHGYNIHCGPNMVRLAAEGCDPGEDFDVYFIDTRTGIVQWSARFSANTPRSVLSAFMAEALAS